MQISQSGIQDIHNFRDVTEFLKDFLSSLSALPVPFCKTVVQISQSSIQGIQIRCQLFSHCIAEGFRRVAELLHNLSLGGVQGCKSGGQLFCHRNAKCLRRFIKPFKNLPSPCRHRTFNLVCQICGKRFESLRLLREFVFLAECDFLLGCQCEQPIESAL